MKHHNAIRRRQRRFDCSFVTCVFKSSAFRCQGGMAAAAWKFYTENGIVTGGNFNSSQVQLWWMLCFGLSAFLFSGRSKNFGGEGGQKTAYQSCIANVHNKHTMPFIREKAAY